MELKPLFVSPDETRIETAILYTTDRSSGSSSTAGAVQLAPGEELCALLYIGCADRTLHVRRIIARAEPSGARYDFTSTFRHRKSLQHLSCDSNDSNGFSSSSSSGGGGVSFLHVNGALDPPLLILVAGGVLDALHSESLADTNVFRRAAAALLPMGSIAACCAEPKPTELSSSLSLSLSLSLSSSSAVRASRGTLSRLALVVGRTLVVVEYDAHSARVVAPHSSSSHSSSSSYSYSFSLLPAGTSAVAWVEGDTIVTGSAHVYCVFDASTRQLRHTIAVGHGLYDDYNSHRCNNNKNNNDNHHPSDGTSGTERGLAHGPLLRGVPSMPHGMSLLLRSADLRIALLNAKDVGAMTTMMTALCAEPTALAAPIIEAIVSPPFVIAVGPDGALRARLLRGAWTGDAEDKKKDTDEDADELPVPSHHRSSFSSSSSSASTLRIDVREMRSLLSSPFGACAVLSGSVQHVTLAPAQTLTMLYMDAGKYGAALRHTTYLSAMKTTTTTTATTTATVVAVQRMGAKCASHALRTKRYAEAFRLFAQCATPTREILCLAPELTRGAGGKIMRTWTSGEPYSLLHAMLLQRYRSPAGQSEKKHIPNDTHSTDDKESIEERRSGDFALFLLHVLECVPHTEEGLAAVFAPESTLSADECLRYVSDSGYCPRPALVPLVLAHAGRGAEAIAHCRARGLAREAAAALRLSRGNEKNEETAAALPWLLAVDARAACTAAVSALTTTTTTTSSSTSADNELESFGSLGTSLRPLLPALLGHGGSALRECLRRAVITATGDEAPRVHTQYARSLIAALRVMRQCGLAGLSAPSVRVAAGEEVGPCGAMRRALLEFLRTSQQYDVDEVLALLMDAGLIEEQVLVHERVGDHVAALTAIVYGLQDVPAAVRYCEAQHKRQKDTGHAVFDRVTRPDSSTTLATTTTTTAATAMAAAQAKSPSKEPNDVVDDKDDSGNDDMAISGGAVHGARVFNEYLDTLLHVLLVPPVGHEPRLSDTLNVLCEHTDSINPLSALHALPGDVRVAEVEPYLLRVFKMLCFETQLAEVAANAAEAMVDEAERYLSLLRQRCVYVDERRPCAVCGETLGVGVTAVFPNLKATHFRCFRAPELDPERGVPFRPPL